METSMAHEGLEWEIERIEETTMQLAVFVEELIARSMEAMAHSDDRLADEVIVNDRVADDLRSVVRRRVLNTIEMWAPVGFALRKIIAFQRIADELERIGDYAVHVARNALLGYRSMPLGIVGEVSEMARLVRQQVREGVQALASNDEALARHVCALDNGIDQHHWALMSEIQDYMRMQPEVVPVAAQLLFAIRDMERIGDRIANISEDVIYIVTGKQEKLN
jgi:phosphate transport system protein